MIEDSLSSRATSASSVDVHTSALHAFPVEGKPHFYVIQGQEYGPDSVFSYAKTRLKGNPYLRAKAYAWAEMMQKGQAVCELSDHYLTYGTAEVHHRVRKNLHLAKTLGIACHSHNAAHGLPSMGAGSQSERRERESGAQPFPPEIDLNVRLFPRYKRWLDERLEVANGIPLSEAIFTATREIREELGHGAHQTIRGYLQVLTEGAEAPYYIDLERKLLHRRVMKR